MNYPRKKLVTIGGHPRSPLQIRTVNMDLMQAYVGVVWPLLGIAQNFHTRLCWLIMEVDKLDKGLYPSRLFKDCGSAPSQLVGVQLRAHLVLQVRCLCRFIKVCFIPYL